MSDILGHWVHAHERDKAGAKVYVDASVPLPPSRGRQRLTFRPDGTFVEDQPGADDRRVQASGSYQIEGTRLVLQRGAGASTAVYEAVRGEGGKTLELKRN